MHGSQVNVDLFKTVKIRMSLNRSVTDVTKELKQKLRVLNIGTNRSSFSQMGLGRPSNTSLRMSDHSSASSRRNTNTQSGQKDANKEDRDELGLYVFKTLARNKILAFRRLPDNEFPLRHLPSDQVSSLHGDGDFEHISTAAASQQSMRKQTSSQVPATKPGDFLQNQALLLCFVSLNQIEAYMK